MNSVLFLVLIALLSHFKLVHSAQNYAEALHKSFLFYHAQKSGKLPYQRLAWRGDSCLNCKGQYGEDLSRGYYEAANTMKWGFPMAFSLSQLGWNIIEFSAGMAAVNELQEAREVLKWGIDYLMSAHVAPHVFVGQYGSSEIDFKYFGPPEEYDLWALGPRPIVYVTEKEPATEIVCESAAALAIASIIFRDAGDAKYAEECLRHAKELYAFGRDFRGSFMNSTNPLFIQQKLWYPSTSVEDELTLSAVWLYKATREKVYLDEALVFHKRYMDDGWMGFDYSWDEKIPAVNILLAQEFKGADSSNIYLNYVFEFLKKWLPGPARTVPHTDLGLAYIYYWGSNRYAANTAFLCFVTAKTLVRDDDPMKKSLIDYATFQINYILGAHGRSWVVGYGPNYPKLPYHKSSYNSMIDYPMRGEFWENQQTDFLYSSKPNKFILYGAVVGGPFQNDSYVDNRNKYEYTEVTQDYNAAFIGAVAALVEIHGGKSFSDCGLDLGWDHPNATISHRPKWPDNDCYHKCCNQAVITIGPDLKPTESPNPGGSHGGGVNKLSETDSSAAAESVAGIISILVIFLIPFIIVA